MPRPINPSNYEEVYWDLLLAMKEEIAEIKLDLAANTAQKVKFTFYAFIRALEAQADRKRKQGDMSAAGELEADANAMRKYLVRIDIAGKQITAIKAANSAPAQLRFINRDLNPETKDFREQLKEQLKHVEPIAVPLGGIKVPSTDAFFTKPLEIKDDSEPTT